MQLQLALLAVLLSLCWCHPHFKELLEEEEEDIHGKCDHLNAFLSFEKIFAYAMAH